MAQTESAGGVGTAVARYPRSDALARRAAGSIAGGVVSLNRKVEPAIAFARARGARLWDVDGNAYVDYHAAFAAHVLGHNDPAVQAAVAQAMAADASLMGSGTTTWEVELAETLRACVPSLELIQLTNSGSEATAHAIRLARAWTGRDHVVLTLGGYNGWHNDVSRAVAPTPDALGARGDDGAYRVPAGSAGIPAGVAGNVHVVPFNDLDAVASALARWPTACVLTEPVLQNIGVVPPRPGYLAGLRRLCGMHGALLVFDEVKTGFRAALGGYQAVCGVRPDLSVFGKAVANGWPLGVIGGRADVMARFADPDPAKRVLIAGTYNAHPFPVAAALATLARLRAGGVYERLEALGARLELGLTAAFRAAGVPIAVSRVGSAFCPYFADAVPVDLHDLHRRHDAGRDLRWRRLMIERGHYLFPVATKQGSISAAHSDDDIDATIAAARDALAVL